MPLRRRRKYLCDIAAFVVVNASGSITDRNGNVVKCSWPPPSGSAWKIADLMTNVPLSRSKGWNPAASAEVPTHRNTTVSLIVTNARLRVDAAGGTLSVTALDRTVFDFPPGLTAQLAPASNTEFYFDRGQYTRLNFVVSADGTVGSMILNPGPWAQFGNRMPN